MRFLLLRTQLLLAFVFFAAFSFAQPSGTASIMFENYQTTYDGCGNSVVLVNNVFPQNFGSGPYTFVWEYKLTAGNSWSQLQTTFTSQCNTGTVAMPTEYRLTIYNSSNQSVTSNIIRYNFIQPPTPPTIAPSSQKIILGNNSMPQNFLSIVPITGNYSSYWIDWQESPDGVTWRTWAGSSNQYFSIAPLNGPPINTEPGLYAFPTVPTSIATKYYRVKIRPNYGLIPTVCHDYATVYSNEVLFEIDYPPIVAGNAFFDNGQSSFDGCGVSVALFAPFPTGGVPPYTYVWQQKLQSSSTWNNIPLANQEALQTSTITQPMHYRRIAIDSRGRQGIGGFASYNLLPYPNPPTLTPTSQVIAVGGTNTFQNIVTQTPASGSYAQMSSFWEMADNPNGPWDFTYGDEFFTITTTINPLAPGLTSTQRLPTAPYTKYFRSRTYPLSNIPQGCSNILIAHSSIITVKAVNPVPINGATISSANNVTSFCIGSTPPSLTVTNAPSGGYGTLTSNWQERILPSGNWTDIANSSATSYQPVAFTGSKMFRRKTVDAIQTIGYSSEITLTANDCSTPLAGGTIQYSGSSNSMCGSTVQQFVNVTAASGGAGTRTYTWQFKQETDLRWYGFANSNVESYLPTIDFTESVSIRRRVVDETGEFAYSNQIVINQVKHTLSISPLVQSLTASQVPNILTATVTSATPQTYSYIWQTTNDTTTNNWTNISGANSNTYSPPSISGSNKFYRYIVSSNLCASIPNYKPVASLVASSLLGGNIGFNNNTTLIINCGAGRIINNYGIPTGGLTPYTYTWQVKAANSNNWVDIPSQNSSSLSSTGTLTQSSFFRRKVTDASGAIAFSNEVEYRFAEVPTAPVLQPSTQTIVIGTSTYPQTITTTTPITGNSSPFFTYWQQSNDPSGPWVQANNTLFQNNFGNSLSPTNTPRTSSYPTTPTVLYLRTATYSTSIPNECVQEVYSAPVEVRVVTASLTGGSIGFGNSRTNTTLNCGLSTTMLEATTPSLGTPPYTFVWQSKPTTSGSWSDLVSQTNSTSATTGSVAVPSLFRRKVSDAAGNIAYSNEIEYLFLAPPTPPVIQPATQTIVLGSGNSLTSLTTLTPITGSGYREINSYWQQSNNNNGPWINASFGPSQNFTTSVSFSTSSPTLVANLNAPQAASITYYRTATYGVASNLNVPTQCESLQTVYSVPVEVRVIEQSINGGIINLNGSTSVTICGGTAPNLISNTSLSSNGVAPFTYTWQESFNGGSSWVDILSTNSINYQPPTLTTNRSYRRKVVDANNYIGYSNIISVNTTTCTTSLLAGNINYSGSTSVCANSNLNGFTNTTAASGGSGILTYEWQQKSSVDNIWNSIANSNSLNYQPSPISSNTTFRRKVTDNLGVSAFSNEITLTIFNPTTNPLNGGEIYSYDYTCTTSVRAPIGNITNASGGNGLLEYVWEQRQSGVWVSISTPSSSANSLSNASLTSALTSTIGTFRRKVIDQCGNIAYSNTSNVSLQFVSAGDISISSNNINSGQTPAIINNSSLPASGTPADYGPNTVPLVISWVSSSNINGPWIVIPNATGLSYQSGSLFQTTYFRRVVMETLCNKRDTTNTIAINVIPSVSQFIGGTIIHSGMTKLDADGIRSKDICHGQNNWSVISMVPASQGVEPYTYTWQIRTWPNGNWTTVTNVYGINNYQAFGISNLTDTSEIRRVVIDASNNVAYSNIVRLNVWDVVTPGTIQPSTQTITASTQNATPLSRSANPSGGSGVYEQTWESSSSANGPWAIIPFSPITTITLPSNLGGSFNLSSQPTQTTYYRAVFRVINSNTGGCVNDLYPSNVVVINVGSCSTSPIVNGPITNIISNTYPSGCQFMQLTGTVSGGGGTFTYLWERLNVGSTVWNPAPTSTQHPNNGLTYLTFIPQDGTKFRRKVTDNCNNISYSEVYEYTRPPLFNVTAGAIGINQTINSGNIPSGLSNIVSPTNYTTIKWQSLVNNSSWQDILSANQLTFQPPALTTSTSYRRIAINNDCPILKPDTSNTINIIVTTNYLNAGTITSPQNSSSICSGSNVEPIINVTHATSSSNLLTYEWQFFNATVGTWVNITNSNSVNYSPQPITQNTRFRRKVTDGNNAIAYSNEIVINIYNCYVQLSGGTIAYENGDAPLCPRTPLGRINNVTQASGGNLPRSYQWQQKPANSNTWYSITYAYDSTYTPAPLSTTTNFRRMVVDEDGTIAYSNVVTITIATTGLPLNGGSVVAQNFTCTNRTVSIPNLINPSGGSTNYGYSLVWEQLQNNSWVEITAPTADASNLTNSILAEPLTNNTGSFRRKVTDFCGNIAYSNHGTAATIANQFVVSGIIAINNNNILPGETPSMIINQISPDAGLATTNGTLQISWQQTNDLNGTWTAIQGANGFTYQPTALTQTTHYRRVARETLCGNAAISNIVTIQVANISTVLFGGVIQTPSNCLPIHSNATISHSGSPNLGGLMPYVFEWEKNENGNWVTIANSNNWNLTVNNLTTSTSYRRKVKDQNNDSSYSNIIKLSIQNAPLKGGIIGKNYLLCSNDLEAYLYEIISACDGGGSFTYQWEYSLSNNTWIVIPNSNTPNYSFINLNADVKVRRKVFDECGNSAVSNSVDILINPQIVAGTLFPANQTVCSNGSTQPRTISLINNNHYTNGTVTYQWQQSASANGTFTDISGATNRVFTPTIVNTTLYYRLKVSSNVCNYVNYTNTVTVTSSNCP